MLTTVLSATTGQRWLGEDGEVIARVDPRLLVIVPDYQVVTTPISTPTDANDGEQTRMLPKSNTQFAGIFEQR